MMNTTINDLHQIMLIEMVQACGIPESLLHNFKQEFPMQTKHKGFLNIELL